MTDWIWQHIIGPALNGVFGLIPWWVWIIVAGLALGWAWKTFGWKGLAGAAAGAALALSYIKGWKDRDSLSAEHVDPNSPDAAPSPSKPKKHSRIPGFDPDTGTWK